MRTTLDIDDDVLNAAKEIAALRGTTAGKALSELARRGLEPVADAATTRNGVPVLGGSSGRRVTLADVNRLRDER